MALSQQHEYDFLNIARNLQLMIKLPLIYFRDYPTIVMQTRILNKGVKQKWQ